jgi:adenylate cyclase
VPNEPPVERRLAAILAGDVVGYSRLVGVDEVGTLRALKAIIADPAIAAHHGRIVKTTGDGILIEFGSVVNAVTCAVAVQEGMAARMSPFLNRHFTGTESIRTKADFAHDAVGLLSGRA